MLTFLAALALQAAPAATPDLDDRFAPALAAADRAIASGKPQEAIDGLAPVIAAFEQANAAETRRIFCGMSPAETVAYMASAAGERRGAIAIRPGYCQALYLRGFALVDLGRLAEARAMYERAIALAPMHAHFLTELGQTYRPSRDWAKMLGYCTQAADSAALAPDADVAREKGFAWRCQGYALIEQGEWDQAEARFRDCLRLDPNDAKAKNELQYIAQQRRRPRA